MRNKWCIWL